MIKQFLKNENTIRLGVLIALILLFGILTSGVSLSTANLSNVLVQYSIRGVAACGQALIILTGGLDLSVSGIIAVAMMIGGRFLTLNPELGVMAYLPSLVGVAVMLIVATGFGFVNGFLVAKARIPSLLVTLGTWQIGVGFAYYMTGMGFVDQIRPTIGSVSNSSFMGLPAPILILVAVVCLTHYILRYTTLGAQIYATGGNSRCAYISGVRVKSIRILVFSIAGFLYGVSAFLSLSYYQGATMAQTTGLELETIAAVAIGGVSLYGGKGTIIGVFLGVLIIGVIGNGLNILGVGPSSQALVKGLLLIVVVMVDTTSWRMLGKVLAFRGARS